MFRELHAQQGQVHRVPRRAGLRAVARGRLRRALPLLAVQRAPHGWKGQRERLDRPVAYLYIVLHRVLDDGRVPRPGYEVISNLYIILYLYRKQLGRRVRAHRVHDLAIVLQYFCIQSIAAMGNRDAGRLRFMRHTAVFPT